MRILQKLTAVLLAAIFLLAVIPTGQANAALLLEPAVSEQQEVSSYRDLLTPVGKQIYDALLTNVKNTINGTDTIRFYFSREITHGDLSVDVYQDAITAFNRDHSEVFWIDFSAMLLSVTDMGSYLIGELSPVSENYYTSAYHSAEEVESDIALMEERIGEIAGAAAKLPSIYERLLYLHDWLVMQNSYNTTSGETYHMRAFEAVSALEGNRTGDSRPVCEGYARAFKLLCDAVQIPCLLITGEGSSGSVKAPHMWNYVKLDNIWYAVDVTWDDPVNLDDQGKISYTFFLVGSETVCSENRTFAESHREIDQFNASIAGSGYPITARSAYSVDTDQASAGMENFKASAAYADGQFSDVKRGAWYETGVADACRYGLMKGTGNGRFSINGRITLAETITLATRIHAIYFGNAEPVSVGGNWYDGYVAYAISNHIISGSIDDYTKVATRAEFSRILSAALPAEELAAVNDVADGAVPDIPADAEYAEAAYLLYRAGVLIGNDKGEFSPNAGISRAEVAVIVTRMVRPDTRVRTTA